MVRYLNIWVDIVSLGVVDIRLVYIIIVCVILSIGIWVLFLLGFFILEKSFILKVCLLLIFSWYGS